MVYLYHHLPKCGGRSFVQGCLQWFPGKHEKIGRFPGRERIAEFARTRLDFDELPQPCFVHGHLVNDGIRPFERYGDYIAAGRCAVITIVRDPLERAVSAYFHRQKRGLPWPEPLEQWLFRGRNKIARYLGVSAMGDWPARLDQYLLIGTTESLQMTLDIMAKKTGNPPVSSPHLNPSPRGDYDLKPEVIEKFRADNALDFLIHQYATERLRREAGEFQLSA